MKKLLPMLLCLLVPAVSFGQGSVVNDIAFKNLVTGIAPAAGATVTVCTSAGTGIPCTPLATVYSDIALTVPLTNPLTADSNGYYSFFAPAGTYIVTITGAGTSGRTVTYTLPFTLSGSNAFSGNNTHSGAETFAQINKTCYVDGVTNTTIPQALTCAGSGGSVYIPKSYSATIGSQINVTNPVSIIIDGASITFNAVLGFSVQASNVSVSCKNNSTITLTGSGASAFG